MADDGLAVTAEQMHPWHGAKKEAVFAHFVEAQGTIPAAEVESRVKRYAATFEDKINDAYETAAAIAGPSSDVGMIRQVLQSRLSGRSL